MRAQLRATENADFVDLISFFCNKEGCLTYLGDDRMTGIASYDYRHLTPAASDYVGKNLLVKAITGDGTR